jgi:Protein of unknown function (DUF4236)
LVVAFKGFLYVTTSLRLWRRFRIVPGLRINLSKSGASVSIGRRGAWFTIGPRGRRATIGLPGTGLFWTQQMRTPIAGPQTAAETHGALAAPDDGGATQRPPAGFSLAPTDDPFGLRAFATSQRAIWSLNAPFVAKLNLSVLRFVAGVVLLLVAAALGLFVAFLIQALIIAPS